MVTRTNSRLSHARRYGVHTMPTRGLPRWARPHGPPTRWSATKLVRCFAGPAWGARWWRRRSWTACGCGCPWAPSTWRSTVTSPSPTDPPRPAQLSVQQMGSVGARGVVCWSKGPRKSGTTSRVVAQRGVAAHLACCFTLRYLGMRAGVVAVACTPSV